MTVVTICLHNIVGVNNLRRTLLLFDLYIFILSFNVNAKQTNTAKDKHDNTIAKSLVGNRVRMCLLFVSDFKTFVFDSNNNNFEVR